MAQMTFRNPKTGRFVTSFEKLRLTAKGVDHSFDWYMRKIRELIGANMTGDKALRSDLGTLESYLEIGSMYLYAYDPKFKKTLPYYDIFPLVIPIDYTNKGFYGLNLHYVPYMVRTKILGSLLDYTDGEPSSTTKMQISWELLKGLSTIKYMQPCIKQYLNTHVKTRFMMIAPTEWKAAIFLPVDNFQKATKQKVFEDSRRMYGSN